MRFFSKKSNDSIDTKLKIKKNKKFRWQKLVKWTVFVVLVVVITKFVLNRFVLQKVNETSAETVIQTANVETRDIQVVLSSSGSVEPLNTYEVSTLVKGEVISANFEEGDQVKEGDVLYQIATNDLDSEIETAERSVTRAEKEYNKALENLDEANENYKEALEDLEEAKTEFGNLDVLSKASGIIKSVFIEPGDTIQKGTQIAEVYDNSSMLLEVPFNASEVKDSMIGKGASVEILDSFETLEGKVIKISPTQEVLSGNRVVKIVTIQVTNPGGLTTANTATASIGDIYSSSEGNFSLLEETVITSELSGEIENVYIEEGDKIDLGDVVAVLSDDSIEDQLDSFQKSVENAEDSIDNAKESLESAEEAVEDAKSELQDVNDSRTDYSITAPISGQVIRKDALVGDTISNTTTLCVIYDLSAVVFRMYVDELDVMSVEALQEVDVTADALEGTVITGVVTNISLESTSSSGVTQYPVTVRIDKVGELLPGMNVTGEIIIEKVEGVLAIPSDALQRDDVVYVADASVTEAVGNIPAGFREIQVETGLTDGDYIEIINGLSGNEEVYVTRNSTATTILPGEAFNFGSERGNFDGSNATRPSGGNFGGGSGNRP